jgi:hypothetical protein
MSKLYLTKKEKWERFQDRFDTNDDTTGVWKLTADGCMKRFDIPRQEVELSRKENYTKNFAYPNREQRLDNMNIAKASEFFQRGMKLRPDESLEEFVARCEEGS